MSDWAVAPTYAAARAPTYVENKAGMTSQPEPSADWPVLADAEGRPELDLALALALARGVLKGD